MRIEFDSVVGNAEYRSSSEPISGNPEVPATHDWLLFVVSALRAELILVRTFLVHFFDL